MTDERKFRASIIAMILLVASVLSYNIFQEYFDMEIGSYMKRRFYYEKVLLKSGVTLHEGKYWRKMEE
jgi:hypothetical protein